MLFFFLQWTTLMCSPFSRHPTSMLHSVAGWLISDGNLTDFTGWSLGNLQLSCSLTWSPFLFVSFLLFIMRLDFGGLRLDALYDNIQQHWDSNHWILACHLKGSVIRPLSHCIAIVLLTNNEVSTSSFKKSATMMVLCEGKRKEYTKESITDCFSEP